MKKFIPAILLVLPLCSFSQYTYKNLQINYADAGIAKNYTYENLQLYPIHANEAFKSEFKSIGKYLSLQDAIAKSKIKITEKNNGGSVNNLTIENISSDTVIIICGDVVKGGKQDRIIQKDMLLKPKSGKKDLEVFCVESGRWTSETNGSLSSRNFSAPAEFKSSYNKGAMSLRKVVEKEKDQAKVWAKVDEINNANKTTTSTKTYTALTNSAEFNKKLEKYLQFFRNKFSADENMMGVVVVTGNKVLGCDMFATHDLFSKQFESLLHSYATEAIVNGKPVIASTATVKAYMDKLLNNEQIQATTIKEKGNAFIEKGRKLRISSFD